MSKHENSKKYFCPRYHVLIDLAFLILSVKYFQLKTRESAFSQKLDTLKSSAIFGNIKGSWNSLSREESWYFYPKKIWKEIWNLSSIAFICPKWICDNSITLSSHHAINTSYLLDSYKLCLPIPTHMRLLSNIFSQSENRWDRSKIFLVCVCFLPFSGLLWSPQTCVIYHRTQNKFLQDTDHN